MPKPKSQPPRNPVSRTKERWASDLIVDLLHAYDLPHAALNPGASYRALHDSIVNYRQNRPRFAWLHAAQNRGEAVRNYTKWDSQPHTIDGAPEAFARAYAVMMTEPRGPIYMCYGACLQEQKLDHEVPLPPAHAAKVPSRLAPEPKVLAAAADLIAAAKKPVIIAEFVGREPEGL